MSATQEHTRRPVHAGCQMKHDREARRDGKSTPKFSRDGETGPRRKLQWREEGNPSTREARYQQYDDILGSRSTHRRPNERQPGSLKDREAHNRDQPGRGGRSTPEAPMGVQGKPVHAGGPTSTIR